MSGFVKCVVLQDVLAPNGQQISFDDKTVGAFGARLGEVFKRYVYYGGRFVTVPNDTYEGFKDTFVKGGYQVLDF